MKKLIQHPEISKVKKTIESHDSVCASILTSNSIANGGFIIKFNMGVSLPSRARANGKSETGVKIKEPVSMYFPPSYPFHAPQIRLRHDFNRLLAHISPQYYSKDGNFVSPCVYNGDLVELLHREPDGLTEILNHLSEWLGKAAINDLIDPSQGWEPIRIDEPQGWIVYDLSEMRSLVTDKEGFSVFKCNCFCTKGPSDNNFHVVDRIDNKNPQKLTPVIINNSFLMEEYPWGAHYQSLIFFVWGNKIINGRRTFVDQYLPESVRNFGQLYEQAEKYHCLKPVQDAFVGFRRAYEEARLRIPRLPLFLVFCVRRPYKLISDHSSLELISYVINCHIERNNLSASGVPQISTTSPVKPLGHRHPVSKNLLKQMSNSNDIPDRGTIVFLGCGSVGSKIVMHLARTGITPFLLVDRNNFSPHNIARHALTPLASQLPLPKAELLANEIESLSLSAKPIQGDIIELLRDSKNKTFHLPEDTYLIIDSTGSLTVREMLCSIAPDILPGRLMLTALYEHGRIGLITIEGPNRNPNTNDLILRFFEERMNDDLVSKRFVINEESISGMGIGLGCSSYTMVMPDTRVSLFAAGMAEKIRQILKKGVPEEGQIWIGLLDENEMGVSWKKIILDKSSKLKVEAKDHWKVRLLAPARDQIENEVQKWGQLETGGVLMGRISVTGRWVSISRILEAPPDSTRDANSFKLGIDGLRKRVQEIQKISSGTIFYVGTWHSHPRGGGASIIDENMLQKLSKNRLGSPSLGLIWTPSGYKAIMEEGRLAESFLQ